jgi:hypothetical protein
MDALRQGIEAALPGLSQSLWEETEVELNSLHPHLAAQDRKRASAHPWRRMRSGCSSALGRAATD